MNTFIQMNTLELSWLLDPKHDNLILTRGDPDVQRAPYGIPPEIGAAWIDSLALPGGIVLYRALHEMSPSPQGQLIPLLDVDSITDEPAFSAQIWLSGLGCHHEYWRGRKHPPTEIIASPGRDTFRYNQAWSTRVLVEGGTTSEMRSVFMPESTMKVLLGEDATDMLLSHMGLSLERQTVVAPMPLNVSAPLRAAISSKFSGAALKLFAQARVLDYFAELLNFISLDRLHPSSLGTDGTIEDLHHHLSQLEGSIPTLTDLAKQFGVSARRLNANFEAKYGQSIYGFITEHRLNQAHTILQTETIAMKTLAMRLGYSHANHFSAAFKRKFGYPPGTLRRAV